MPRDWQELIPFYRSLEAYKHWGRASMQPVIRFILENRDTSGLYPFTSHETLCITKLETYAEWKDEPFVAITPASATDYWFKLVRPGKGGETHRERLEAIFCRLGHVEKAYDEVIAKLESTARGDGRATDPCFLKSERLGLRPWAEADLELALGLWGDPEVTGLIGGPFTRAQVQERLASEIAVEKERGIQYWPMFLLEDGEHVGCCGLRPYRDEAKVFELGVHLNKARWGRGYAPEAARTVMAYAFDILRAGALFAGHHPRNEASRRLLQKLRFAYTHDEHYPPTGLLHPSYLLTDLRFWQERNLEGADGVTRS